jgi:hypothetical protein
MLTSLARGGIAGRRIPLWDSDYGGAGRSAHGACPQKLPKISTGFRTSAFWASPDNGRMSDAYTVLLRQTRLTEEQRAVALSRFRAMLEQRLGSAEAVCAAKAASDAARASAPGLGNAAMNRWLNAFSAAHFHALADRFHEPVEFEVELLRSAAQPALSRGPEPVRA